MILFIFKVVVERVQPPQLAVVEHPRKVLNVFNDIFTNQSTLNCPPGELPFVVGLMCLFQRRRTFYIILILPNRLAPT